MAGEYMPRTDADFTTWLQAFVTYVSNHAAGMTLDPNIAMDLATAQGVWTSAYSAHATAQDAAFAAREAKDLARHRIETAVRTLVRQLQASTSVTNADRAGMGINVRDSTPTAVPPPATRPILILGLKTPQRLEINFADEGTPTKRAKPAGVRGAEIYIRKTTAPATDADWQFLALDTATPYTLEFDEAEIGTSVWVRARWVNTTGASGPWSPTATAKVPG